MNHDSLDDATSPFHVGEREAQARAGVRARVERVGRRMIHDHVPPHIDDFLVRLPWLVLAAVDGRGRPWASIATGPPGFVHAPEPQRLRIAGGLAPADPLAGLLDGDAPLGVLGIEPHTRRRVRVNGRVRGDAAGLTLRVGQVFGNCPRYIHPRTLAPVDVRPGQPCFTAGLDARARGLVGQADTLFVATVAPGDPDDPRRSADASHRGGPAGFVAADGDTLTFRDLAGNGHFNTIGNLMLEPRAGLTFVDFARGDILQVSGRAAVEWDGDGRERTVRVTVEAAVRRPGGLPLRLTG